MLMFLLVLIYINSDDSAAINTGVSINRMLFLLMKMLGVSTSGMLEVLLAKRWLVLVFLLSEMLAETSIFLEVKC